MSDERFVANRELWRDVGKVAGLGLLVGVGILVLGRLTGGDPSILICLGVPTAAGALLQMLLLTLNEDGLPDSEPLPPVKPTPLPIVRLRQLERRLEGASLDGSRFDWSIRPILLELVDDRLRYKYAVNLRTAPERARSIIGEQLWRDLNSPQNTTSSAISLTRLQALVAAIEAL